MMFVAAMRSKNVVLPATAKSLQLHVGEHSPDPMPRAMRDGILGAEAAPRVPLMPQLRVLHHGMELRQLPEMSASGGVQRDVEAHVKLRLDHLDNEPRQLAILRASEACTGSRRIEPENSRGL